MADGIAGYVISTLNGWAALTREQALIGYYDTEDDARSAARSASDPKET